MRKYSLFATVLAVGFLLGGSALALADEAHHAGDDAQKPKVVILSVQVAQAESGETIEGVGVVNAVMAEDRKVNLTHEPIPAIDWPTMTMGFEVAEDVDLTALKAGDRIRFTLGDGGGGTYRILSVESAD